MKLRKLKDIDAPYMLEWMRDESVVEYMKADFKNKIIDDCVSFIEAAKSDSKNIHFAIVDDNDEYMGTVSLKNIIDGSAEFAITIRACAMGHGYSKFGMSEIIKYAFNELELNVVYWYVDSANKRAVSFYDKNGYRRVEDINEYVDTLRIDDSDYIWYVVTREEH